MANDDSEYGADFDDDVSFLDIEDEDDATAGKLPPQPPPSSSAPEPPQPEESVAKLTKEKQGTEDINDRFESDGMDADDEIFLQVDETLCHTEEIVNDDPSEISDTPKQIDPSKTATYFLTPTSNFSVTPPNFDASDSDDELLGHLDMDITSLSSQQASAAAAPKVDQNMDTTIPGFEAPVPSTSNTTASSLKPVTPSTVSRECDSTTTSAGRSKLRARRSNPSRKTPAARRFPGPAGLLPNLKPVEFKSLNSPKGSNPVSRKIHDIIASHQNQPPAGSQLSSQVIYCSQEEASVFERQTWMELMFQLKLNSEDTDSDSPLNLMNIDWIRTRAARLPGCRKVPFLAAVIHEAPELISRRMGGFKAPCVTLTDATGSIDAAVDPSFLNAYFTDLVPGTALALKNVGLLRIDKRNLMLTITEQNVICMTSQQETDEPKKPNRAGESPSRDTTSKARHVVLTEEGVRVTEFCDFHPEKVLELYFKMNSAVDDELEIEDDEEYSAPPEPVRPIGLFATTRVSGPSFFAPRSTVPAGPAINSNTNTNMFISNRTAPPANPVAVTNPIVNNDSNASDFGDDDDDAFFLALEIGFGTNDF